MSETKKILLAEDEIHIAMAVKAILKKGLPDCIVDHARNGDEAWNKVRSNDYQLIISDWNMPKKNGDEFLADMRGNKDTEKTPFIMLSARGDRDSHDAAIKAGANDYVIKPFKTPEFISKVKSLLEDSPVVRDDLVPVKCLADLVVAEFKKGHTNLSVLPETVVNLNRLFQRGDATMDQVARVIEQDLLVSSEMIRIANTPLVSDMSACLSIDQVIARLGLAEAKNYAVVLANKNILKSGNVVLGQVLENLWRHSLETAYFSKLLAIKLNRKNSDKLFLMGLVHDVGKLLLVDIIDGLSVSHPEIDAKAVNEVMVSLHSGFGSMLIRAWGFGDEFQEIVRFHHAPFDSDDISFELLVVYLANFMVDYSGEGKDVQEAAAIASSQAAIRLGLTSEAILAVINEANDYLVYERQAI